MIANEINELLYLRSKNELSNNEYQKKAQEKITKYFKDSDDATKKFIAFAKNKHIDDFKILRVASGWIYTNKSNNILFVPFNNKFENMTGKDFI